MGRCAQRTSAREVVVCGWAQRQRDLGQLIFIDLRDRTGIVQLAFDDSTDRSVFDKAFSVRAEFVLAARGRVRERSSKNSSSPPARSRSRSRGSEYSPRRRRLPLKSWSRAMSAKSCGCATAILI